MGSIDLMPADTSASMSTTECTGCSDRDEAERIVNENPQEIAILSADDMPGTTPEGASGENVPPEYNWTSRARKNPPTSGLPDGLKPGRPTHQAPLIVSELKPKPKPVDPRQATSYVPSVATAASASAHVSVQTAGPTHSSKTAPKTKQKKCTIV